MMAVKMFTLKKTAICTDCGKKLEVGEVVRGYPLPKGGQKIYCEEHKKQQEKSLEKPQENSQEKQSQKQITSQPTTTGAEPSGKAVDDVIVLLGMMLNVVMEIRKQLKEIHALLAKSK